MNNSLEKFFSIDNYKQTICFKFRELYQDYRTSDHCRASTKISSNIEQHIINIINNNLDKLENKNFEDLFNIVKKIILMPIEYGGGKLNRYRQGGKCGISVLGCYDITMCLVKSIPNWAKRPNSAHLTFYT